MGTGIVIYVLHGRTSKTTICIRAVDPHSFFFADPDPAVFLNAAPDPGGTMNADPSGSGSSLTNVIKNKLMRVFYSRKIHKR